jgi:hypothetical protein
MKIAENIKTKIHAFLDKPEVKLVLLKLKNRYVITLLAFFVWITFIDDNNLVRRFLMWREYQSLEETRQYYIDKIKRDRAAMQQLDKNKNLERLAREKYLMKKDDEDIFIIQEE